MNLIKNKKNILAIISVIVWMIIVFLFSNEVSEESTKTSYKVIDGIIKIVPSINELEDNEKIEISKKIFVPIRKIAHITLYTLGGILIYNAINIVKAEVKNKKKIIISFFIGLTYAITDEIHQIFVPGRAAQITDILIDSLGIIIGIVIINKIIGIINYIKENKGQRKLNCKQINLES